MTTEQLNVIITAQTADFTEKLSAVNRALRETIGLAERAAAAAARVVDPTGDGAAELGTSGAVSDLFEGGQTSAAADGGFPSAPLGSAREAVRSFAEEDGSAAFAALGTVSPVFAAANVVRADRDQTPFGVFLRESRTERGNEESAPIEIRTTVELDGDRIGEAVAAYNGRRNRITDGFSG